MTKKQRKARNEYQRKWAKAHPEKVLAAYKKWVKANPEKVRQYSKQYAAAHPQTVAAYKKKWAKEHATEVREYQRQYRKTHKKQYTYSYTFSPEYRAWSDMLSRCYNPNVKDYRNWGGRGIQVCTLWRKSSKAFLAYMGKRPKGKSLDRINNHGHYVPGNVQWATKQQQTIKTKDEEEH